MKASKQKTLQCKYCSDTFHRREHLERHERTHTKEKPFPCPCGKAFGRRDLLIRHTRLVHRNGSYENESEFGGSPSSRLATDHSRQQSNTELQDSMDTGSPNRETGEPRTRMGLQDVPESMGLGLRITRGHTIQNQQFGNFQTAHVDILDGQMDDLLYSNLAAGAMAAAGTQAIGSSPEYNLFLDDYQMANFYLPAALFDSDLPTTFWSQPNWSSSARPGNQNTVNGPPQNEDNDPISRFGSRLPSLEPETLTQVPHPVLQAYSQSSEPSWKVNGQAYREIQLKIAEFQSVLPEDFKLPSRHALSRFVEGYITGFHRHLPFLHSPTFATTRCVPELLLAICAVGAQYRFESWTATHLWYAARAVAMEQKRRRNSQGSDLKSPTPHRRSTSYQPPGSGRSRPITAIEQGLDSRHGEKVNDPRHSDSQARLGTIQTFLILMAMGMWSHRALLDEATLIQGQLALLLREHGSFSGWSTFHDGTWDDWICFESDCRTRCIAYCFFNLYSIAYDTTPAMLAAEVNIDLPQSAEMWRAASAAEWKAMHEKSPPTCVSFQGALRALFSGAPQDELPPISSLGNYALIGATIQQIYLARQASRAVTFSSGNSNLRPEDIEMFERTLKKWQVGWEETPESSLDPTNPFGPVAFSSTALLRLAYIRLHCDLGPHRALGTRDSQAIMRALEDAPPVVRGPHMSRAIIHAAHALSIPVKIGINFVAHTQTLLWSMQHALVNLECAYLLSKWLQTIAEFLPELTSDEQSLLQMVRSIVNETHFAVSLGNNEIDPVKVRQLGVAVVRIWAETFSGSHHVFPLVRVIGEALDTYADLREASI